MMMKQKEFSFLTTKTEGVAVPLSLKDEG
jgi:hypothetical protein